jgi:hypothetical protein
MNLLKRFYKRQPELFVIVSTVCFLIGAFILTTLFFLFGYWPYHNYQLSQMKNRATAIAHPKDSTHVYIWSDVAHYAPSNICDFHVIEVRTSMLSETEIRKSYANMSISAIDGKRSIVPALYFSEEDIGPDTMYPWEDAKKDNPTIFNSGHDYILYFFDGGYDRFADARCG